MTMTTTLRFALIALLTGTLAVAACGKKGDPIRPGSDEDRQEETTS